MRVISDFRPPKGGGKLKLWLIAIFSISAAYAILELWIAPWLINLGLF